MNQSLRKSATLLILVTVLLLLSVVIGDFLLLPLIRAQAASSWPLGIIAAVLAILLSRVQKNRIIIVSILLLFLPTFQPAWFAFPGSSALIFLSLAVYLGGEYILYRRSAKGRENRKTAKVWIAGLVQKTGRLLLSVSVLAILFLLTVAVLTVNQSFLSNL